MSWQAYVDNQICAAVSCRVAVIAGLTDGAVWAKFEKDLPSEVSCLLLPPPTPPQPLRLPRVVPLTPVMQVTQEELKKIADGMRSNPGSFTTSGIWLGGEKYFCLNAESSLLRGRKGSSALCVVATNTCECRCLCRCSL